MNQHSLIHHDGSCLYLSNTSPKMGQSVTVYLRVPESLTPTLVMLRSVRDGEPVSVQAVKVERPEFSGTDSWWQATLLIHNPRTNYRWLVSGGNVGYGWLTQTGWSGHDINDASDFVLTSYGRIADWARSAVFYQIFPDRFAKSERTYELPDWAIERDWEQLPEGSGPNTSGEYFGGDLWGVIEKLDEIQALGANVLYFTPFFPAGSTHRYDASSFDEVDPLLGGNRALIALVEAAHSRGMGVMGDITLNHSGDKHEWFTSALAGDPTTREFYSFDDSLPHGYEAWLGVASLPKFNYQSEALREALISSENSVLRKWLKPPFNLDGWRVDVANMSGRLGDIDLTHEVARLARQAVEAEGPGKILIAEHNHDAGSDLTGDGWLGNMNYTAFRNPICSWLVSDENVNEDEPDYRVVRHGLMPRISSADMISVQRSYSSRMPWQTYSSSWNLLSSHDSPRIRSIVGSADRHFAAATLLCTMPGSPMIFAGDEIGLTGQWGEDSRSPYPWQASETWDVETLEKYKKLIYLRISSDALTRGGLRYLQTDDNHIAFLRESETERVLILVTRDKVGKVYFDAEALGISKITGLIGFDAELTGKQVVVNANSAGAGVWRLN